MTKSAPDLAAVHATLVQSIETLIQSNDWAKHLKAQAAFHSYSFSNVVWLMAQASERGVEPVKFAGFNTWKKTGRFVKKGEKSFRVLAPVFVRGKKEEDDRFVLRGFRVVATFEKSQTEGRDVPVLIAPLHGTSEEILSTYEKLKGFVQGRGWAVSKGDTFGANGYADLVGKEIVISRELSDLQALKTLCHEAAHSLMHADADGHHGRQEREVEAESVAFVVLTALGFDASGYSFGYVAAWSGGDVELVKKTGERVQRAAKAILDAVATKADDAEEAEVA